MSDAIEQTNKLFFAATEINENTVQRQLQAGLQGCDDGELFLEYSQSESISFDDGRIKNAAFDTAQGFGLRAIAGDSFAYAHSGELSDAALGRAAATVQAVRAGYQGSIASPPPATNRHYYPDANPLTQIAFADKVGLLAEIDAYLRGRDARVKQVSANIAGHWQAVQIRRADGAVYADIRPLVRLNVSVVVGQDGRMESGSHGLGGRRDAQYLIDPKTWRFASDEALRQALVNLEARPAPAGEMPVVLGAGWPGVLLHEAVGHGLEGDFHRKQSSVFTGMLGQRVAAKGVHVVDDGTIADRRGSITIDDEGTPSQRNLLIEDGILVGLLQDRLNARLLGVAPTGNGRRQSYAHHVMPRMTNTFMLSGEHSREEMIASVSRGIYAANFGGGQVDIVSGKFVFTASEAYMIEDGKITHPIKGATLIGAGADALTKIRMIGNDMELDPGIGTCGKDGQGVPVGVGQPSLRIDGLTVGGTAA